jgi:hypothetical protein
MSRRAGIAALWVAGALAAGCVTTPELKDGVPVAWVTVAEDEAGARFVLTLENRSQETFCISESSWARGGYLNSRGTLEAGDSYLVQDGAPFRARMFASRFASADLFEVRAGGALTGYVYFDQFPGVNFAPEGGDRTLHLPAIRLRPCWWRGGVIRPEESAADRTRRDNEAFRAFWRMALEDEPADMSRPLPPPGPGRPPPGCVRWWESAY